VGQAFLQGHKDSRGGTVLVGAFEATTFPSGVFALEASPDTYTVVIQKRGYLKAVKEGVVVEADKTVFLTRAFLLAGDVNEDDAIDHEDVFQIAESLGTSPPAVPGTDINGDGQIDILDLALAGANYGRRAPSPWPDEPVAR
jgi:hypothetical protein